MAGGKAGAIVAVLAATLWGGMLGYCQLTGRATLLDRLEGPLLDLRFLAAGPRAPPGSVAIVALDDEAVRAAGRYPVPRDAIARLVDAIAAQNPRAVGLDILFLDPGEPARDAALAAALGRVPSVLAAGGAFASGAAALARPSGIPRLDSVDWPISPLRRAAGVGLANLSADSGGTPRHAPLVMALGDRLIPSFALRVAAMAAGAEPHFGADRLRIGTTSVPLDLGANLPLRFYGPRGTVPTLSATALLNGTAPKDVLNGRAVLIGVTARGTGDTFATPFDPVLPGVEVLATAVAHLLAGDGLVRDPAVRRYDALAALLLPGLAVGLIAWRRIGLGLMLICVAGAIWGAGVLLAFRHGVWLSMAVPLGAVLPPVLLFSGMRLWFDRRTERRLERAQAGFQRFHPQALAARLVSTPDFLDRPVRRDAAILFIDLSGFTGRSERLGPDRTRDLLKQFHALVESVIAARGGLIVNYMGDGAMIAFGLLAPRDGDARRALDAAVALAAAVGDWIGGLEGDIRGGLGVRVGAHFGPVILSRLGGDSHQQITASGDTVNVASRLLEIAAARGALVAAADDLCAAAGETPCSELFGPAERVPIRGRAQPLAVRFHRRRNPSPSGPGFPASAGDAGSSEPP